MYQIYTNCIYILYIDAYIVLNPFRGKINCAYLHNNLFSAKNRKFLLRFRPGCLDDKLKSLLFNRMFAVKVSVGHGPSEGENSRRTSTAQKEKTNLKIERKQI